MCRVKEAERVDLELQLTQVQENLKKSLTGGVLGASVEAKPPLKVTVVAKWHVRAACSRTYRLVTMSSCVGLQKKDTKYLQWDFTGELCHRAASETPVCVCFYRNGHAEGQGAASTRTPSRRSLSLSSSPSDFTVCHHLKGFHVLRPHWAHRVQHFAFPHFLGHWFVVPYWSTDLQYRMQNDETTDHWLYIFIFNVTTVILNLMLISFLLLRCA